MEDSELLEETATSECEAWCTQGFDEIKMEQ